jgi:hypothetical protein
MKSQCIIRLDSEEHFKLKEYATARGISINELLSNIIGALNDGRIKIFVQEPKVSVFGQSFEYRLVAKGERQ